MTLQTPPPHHPQKLNSSLCESQNNIHSLQLNIVWWATTSRATTTTTTMTTTTTSTTKLSAFGALDWQLFFYKDYIFPLTTRMYIKNTICLFFVVGPYYYNFLCFLKLCDPFLQCSACVSKGFCFLKCVERVQSVLWCFLGCSKARALVVAEGLCGPALQLYLNTV